jgi:hypothetical protein
VGERLGAGDVVTCVLDLDARTLAVAVNGAPGCPPFSGVRGPVVPAVCAGPETFCTITIEGCCHW